MSTNKNHSLHVSLAALVILLLAVWSYFLNYHYPTELIWDESYHIAAAEKYLHGVMFMEPHPPLGKLLIALGEWLVAPNQALDTRAFLATDNIQSVPENYSFVGVRLFPTLFAVAAALLFFNILLQLSSQLLPAILFSSFYLFENAMIVHSRTAMLESIQIFFIFAAISYFLFRFRQANNSSKHYLILGLFIGLAVSVKLNSLILFFLFPALLFYPQTKPTKPEQFKHFIVSTLTKGCAFIIGISSVFCLVYYIHFGLNQNIVSQTYAASKDTLNIVGKKESAYPSHFFTQLKDHLRYIKKYQQGVPLQHTPGSSPGTWPFGNKSIQYLKEEQSGILRFLYLQGNPVIWLLALIGVILSISQIIAEIFFAAKRSDKSQVYLIKLFTLMYLFYLLSMFNLNRVLYLYHYLIPLFFGTFLFYLQFQQVFISNIRNKSKTIYIMSTLLLAEIFFCYLYFSPLTYYQPLSHEAFIHRQWMDFWHLKITP